MLLLNSCLEVWNLETDLCIFSHNSKTVKITNQPNQNYAISIFISIPTNWNEKAMAIKNKNESENTYYIIMFKINY